MATDTPPRFVPTLTETNVSPSTAVEDTAYFEQRDPVDSMLDLDLSELETPVTRIEQVSPLGAYQSGSSVAGRDAIPEKSAASLNASKSGASERTVPVRGPSIAAEAQEPVRLPFILPSDWQAQLQGVIQQSVRQELQQQMPFLLLQWSKQIEDKLAPHIYQQLVDMVQEWQQTLAKKI